MDSVKQSAALCLLRLYKTSPDLVLMGEWTSRVVHLLNDQHMVSLTHGQPHESSLCQGFSFSAFLPSGCGHRCDLLDHLSQPEEP